MSDCEKLAKTTLMQTDLVRELPSGSAGRELAFMKIAENGEALARAVLEQKETIEKKDAVIKALEAQADPDNPLIPWDQAKAELQIHGLEEEIERLESELRIEKASQATRGNN